MTAYIVVEAYISDAEKFAAYARAVPGLVTQFGGEYLVLGGEQQQLEGGKEGARTVIHRWPSLEAARAFWFSPEYEAIKTLRHGTGVFNVRLVQGMAEEVLT